MWIEEEKIDWKKKHWLKIKKIDLKQNKMIGNIKNWFKTKKNWLKTKEKIGWKQTNWFRTEKKTCSSFKLWFVAYQQPKTWYFQRQTSTKLVFRLYSMRCTVDLCWTIFRIEQLDLESVGHDSWHTSNLQSRVKSTATLFYAYEKKKRFRNHYQLFVSWIQNAYQVIYLQTVEDQHKANNQIVHEEIVAISKKSAGQSLKIANWFEIVEIEEFRPWP